MLFLPNNSKSKPFSMKTTVNFGRAFILIVVAFFNATVYGQSVAPIDEEGGGNYPATYNDAKTPCISPLQYEMIEKNIKDKNEKLKLKTGGQRTTSTAFEWPLQMAPGFNDCNYYLISNYVDEDATTGIKDYNCGSVTYDGHRGTDIAINPFPFYKMDNNSIDVVAAAPGTIIAKQDGHYDRNCAMNSDTANYIVVQHADGSEALYWHMKKYSVTAKTVGETVATGDFLGVVGSSGSSTGPHMHFEIWANSSSSSLRDPWAGTCNALGGTSWWARQKPYTEPAVLRVQVNSVLAVFPGCPTTESPNEDSCFNSGGTAKFYLFLRNESAGDTVYERIINPDGSTFLSWTHNSTTSYLGSYWYTTKTLPSTPGVYLYDVEYKGTICTKTFMVDCAALGLPAMSGSMGISVFPNPAGNEITLAGEGLENGLYSISLKNLIGQIVTTTSLSVQNNTAQKSIDISGLPAGVYLLTMQSCNTRIVRKVVKQ